MLVVGSGDWWAGKCGDGDQGELARCSKADASSSIATDNTLLSNLLPRAPVHDSVPQELRKMTRKPRGFLLLAIAQDQAKQVGVAPLLPARGNLLTYPPRPPGQNAKSR